MFDIFKIKEYKQRLETLERDYIKLLFRIDRLEEQSKPKFTINELREKFGLPPIKGGEAIAKPINEYDNFK